MGRKKKENKKPPILKTAEHQASMLIAVYGVDKAEIIAKLTLQKIRAQQKFLEGKYGKADNKTPRANIQDASS